MNNKHNKHPLSVLFLLISKKNLHHKLLHRHWSGTPRRHLKRTGSVRKRVFQALSEFTTKSTWPCLCDDQWTSVRFYTQLLKGTVQTLGLALDADAPGRLHAGSVRVPSAARAPRHMLFLWGWRVCDRCSGYAAGGSAPCASSPASLATQHSTRPSWTRDRVQGMTRSFVAPQLTDVFIICCSMIGYSSSLEKNLSGGSTPAVFVPLQMSVNVKVPEHYFGKCIYYLYSFIFRTVGGRYDGHRVATYVWKNCPTPPLPIQQ